MRCLCSYPAIFREFRFTSEVPIWLDYHGKHVVIEQVRRHSNSCHSAWPKAYNKEM